MDRNEEVIEYPRGMLGLGARRAEGFGAIGPLGNAATIAGGPYKITGTGVNFRNSSLASTGGTLNIGDDFKADGGVKGTEVNGVYTNFASGTSRLGSGYVAVQYLAPADNFQPALYQSGSASQQGSNYSNVSKTTTTTTTVVESEWTDYVPYALGALAVGGLAYALFFTKPGKVTRRYARAKYHAHKRRRARKR